MVRLHAEGWSVSSIAEYLATSRQTVYTTLKRWVEEGVRGLEDKSRARKAPRVVTLDIANEIRKKQENPLIGEWRMHAALLQMGISVSPYTCGRIMAKHRALYGWDKPKGPAKPKKDMPFKASRRHAYWSIDVRYIEHHQLPNVKGPVYVMSVLENFSRMLFASILSEKQEQPRICGYSPSPCATTVLQKPLSLMEEEYSTRCVLWLFTRPWTSVKNGSIPGNPGKITLRRISG